MTMTDRYTFRELRQLVGDRCLERSWEAFQRLEHNTGMVMAMQLGQEVLQYHPPNAIMGDAVTRCVLNRHKYLMR